MATSIDTKPDTFYRAFLVAISVDNFGFPPRRKESRSCDTCRGICNSHGICKPDVPRKRTECSFIGWVQFVSLMAGRIRPYLLLSWVIGLHRLEWLLSLNRFFESGGATQLFKNLRPRFVEAILKLDLIFRFELGRSGVSNENKSWCPSSEYNA